MVRNTKHVLNVKALYDNVMPENMKIHDLLFPGVYGNEGYVGQYSDNSADDLRYFAKRSGMGPGVRVLDVGCGPCGPATLFATEFGCNVVGVDISEIHLARARDRIHELGLQDRIQLVRGDFYRTYFEIESFHVVIGIGAWCHFRSLPLFRRCFKLLRKGGRIAFMERVRLGKLSKNEMENLCRKWECPNVESFDTYKRCLEQSGFDVPIADDLTPKFRIWQERSIERRLALRDHITALTGDKYFRTALALATYEAEVTERGKLGYGLFVGVKP
jgi:cyclopropane fatty-acyl-phospholipid synthase-like methyltransferase